MKLLLLLLIVSITKRTSSAWLTTRTPRGLALTTRQYLLNNDGNNDSNGVVNSDKKSLTSKSKTDKLLENARKLREEAELLEKQNKEDAARLSMDNTERSSDSITTNSNVSSNNVFLKNKNYEFASPDIKMPSIQEKQGEITVKKEAVSNRLTTLLEDRASSTARKELIQKLSSGNRTPTNKRLPPKTTATSDESTDAEVTTTIDGDNGKISWLISKDDDEIEIDMVLTQREKKNERAEKDAVLVGSNIAELKELPKLDSMYSQMKPWWKRWVLQTYGHTVAIQLTDDEEEQQLHETAYAMLVSGVIGLPLSLWLFYQF